MRSQWSRVFTSVVVASLMSASLAAQTLSVPDVLVEGQVAAVIYSDPSRAGQQIQIEIRNNKILPETQVITITLNANGVGAAGWTVPSWDKATFSGPGVASVTREVQ